MLWHKKKDFHESNQLLEKSQRSNLLRLDLFTCAFFREEEGSVVPRSGHQVVREHRKMKVEDEDENGMGVIVIGTTVYLYIR